VEFKVLGMAKKSHKQRKKGKLLKQGIKRRRKKKTLLGGKLVPVNPESLPKEVLDEWDRCKEAEKRRERLGLVRPIIHIDWKGYKLVGVGSQLHYSKKWKTFLDFLMDYIKTVLGGEWGTKELKKPFEKQHQIIKWYVEACNFQKKQTPNEDGMYEAIPNGALEAYVLLAYDLYILRHHSAFQEDVIRRLKHKEQFQGARYELLAAATCVKAGFDIEYEDEKDRKKTHVEFIATHKRTGQKVCVEAKSRHREGVLGQPGSVKNGRDIKVRIGNLLNSALKKEHNHPLVVFIDFNLPPRKAKDIFKKPISGEIKKIITNIEKTYGNIDKFNLIVFTNVHPHYAYGDEPPGPINMGGILSSNPEIMPENPQAIIDIFNAATVYGNVPNEFPED